MNENKPMTPEGKLLSISINHLTVITLMGVASESPAEARKQVDKLSAKAAKKLLGFAVDIGGLLLRLDAQAASSGGAASATELFTAIANGAGDAAEEAVSSSTLH